MLIGSKLPPVHVDKTYFNFGRSAFAYLIEEIIKPNKVYLPAFTCWSLVSTMQKRFSDIELEFYNVEKDLKCNYPKTIEKDEVLVFIHYFGNENKQPLPKKNGGVILEDISHALASKIEYRGDYIFGSLRKSMKVADGGIIINHFFNPIYEKGNNLDSWLRYEATDWKDMREAENMIDRHWKIRDISSQSLEVFLATNLDLVKKQRFNNEKYLYNNIKIGEPLLNFSENEAPLVHNRIMNTQDERDHIRKELSKKGIFTSIHWPTHEVVRKYSNSFPDVLWLEKRIISIPVSQDFNLNDMDFISKTINNII
ncbi:MAG: hypothetical protein K9J25_06585 [Bacteroidales bacterium]|nr:hypothetical protein [Bacteroidales bacterium]